MSYSRIRKPSVPEQIKARREARRERTAKLASRQTQSHLSEEPAVSEVAAQARTTKAPEKPKSKTRARSTPSTPEPSLETTSSKPSKSTKKRAAKATTKAKPRK